MSVSTRRAPAPPALAALLAGLLVALAGCGGEAGPARSAEERARPAETTAVAPADETGPGSGTGARPASSDEEGGERVGYLPPGPPHRPSAGGDPGGRATDEPAGRGAADQVNGPEGVGAPGAQRGGGAGAADPAAPDAAERTSAPEGGAPERAPSGEGSAVNLEGVGHDLGSYGARLRVIEMMDYGCYYCRRFHLETFPSLRAEYVETGEVLWKVIPFVLGSFPNSPAAAVAAECAGRQGAFEPMSRRLFERQREWSRSDDAPALMREYARAEGLEPEAFDACVRDPEVADRIRANTEISRRLGVRGTPTFFVLGHSRIPGAVPLDFFRDLLDRALAERR